MPLSRRALLAGGLCGCLGCSISSWGRPLPTNVHSLVAEGYSPSDPDERGMWKELERLEEDLASSSLLFQAPDLKDYTLGVMERLLGRPATDLRIYLVRDSAFNASMAPNGLMIVHTGFMARVRNEAQYAAVLGHEAGHYFRKHSLNGYRDLRTKAAVAAFVAAGAGAAAGYSARQGYNGGSWIDIANAINQNLLFSLFRFNRDQESEADAFGISMMAKAKYSPMAASDVWRQLMEERQRSALERNKKYKVQQLHAFSTHPPPKDRMRDLGETAELLVQKSESAEFGARADEWQRAIAPHRSALLDEQIKLNDPGASLYLVENLAQDGWSGTLRFHEGEIYRLRNETGDDEIAARSFAAAVAYEDVPPEAWRAHGYALIKSGRRDDGRQALGKYLELRPDATDAAMVRFSLSQ